MESACRRLSKGRLRDSWTGSCKRGEVEDQGMKSEADRAPPQAQAQARHAHATRTGDVQPSSRPCNDSQTSKDSREKHPLTDVVIPSVVVFPSIVVSPSIDCFPRPRPLHLPFHTMYGETANKLVHPSPT
jgi:hypothetical protein